MPLPPPKAKPLRQCIHTVTEPGLYWPLLECRSQDQKELG